MKSLSFFSKYEELVPHMELSSLVLEVSAGHFLSAFKSRSRRERCKHLDLLFENLKSFGLSGLTSHGRRGAVLRGARALRLDQLQPVFPAAAVLLPLGRLQAGAKGGLTETLDKFERLFRWDQVTLMRAVSLANLGMPRIALKLLHSRVRDGSKNPLFRVFLVLFRLMQREHSNLHLGLDPGLRKEDQPGNFAVRSKELSIQARFLLPHKKGGQGRLRWGFSVPLSRI